MNENRKTIILTIKIVIGLACVWLISQRLYDSYSPENFSSLKDIFSGNNLLALTCSCLLLTVNWGIEVQKWIIITKPFEKISFGKAWQSVWTGVCIGNLTPGRLGEFAGRMLYFSPPNRAKAATSHFVSGITQMVVTMVIGCFGLIFFVQGLNKGTYSFTLIVEGIFLLVLLIVLLRINKVITWLLNTSRLKNFNFEGLSYPKPMLFKLLGLSLVRYFVFSFQFFLILKACGVSGDIGMLAPAISIMYLILSTVPMISVIEVAVRAYIVTLLFGFHQNDWQLTAASTLLWLINIVVPSLIGYIFILKNNFSFSTKQA